MSVQNKQFIKISPEYGCYPIWIGTDGTVFMYDDEETVMECPDISTRLKEWDNIFQSTFDSSYPPDSRFESAQQLFNFEKEGLAIWKLIISKFSDFVVLYDSVVFNKVYDSPECLSIDIDSYDFYQSDWLKPKEFN